MTDVGRPDHADDAAGVASNTDVAIVGGGPAGLAAAEVLCASGLRIDLFDAMPSVGRKFLMAGKGGLNLTHSEPFDRFLCRYGAGADTLRAALESFGPDALRAWAGGLGVETFVGTSGRVFPVDFKAAPLLRAWLQRLRSAGARIHVRHRWLGWRADGALRFDAPAGRVHVRASATVLALGGGSWARLGSDGRWIELLEARGIRSVPLRPANCGFDAAWSPHFSERQAGAPVKAVRAGITPDALTPGEFVVTATGVEGSLIYALSVALRDRIESEGAALLYLDLAPGRSVEDLARALSRPRGKLSLSNFLRRYAGLEGVKVSLLRECTPTLAQADGRALAVAIKRCTVRLIAPRPLDEAISTAGGVPWAALDDNLMLSALPGVFCAGEMLDWEAPTGGYLLTACMATGRRAGAGVRAFLDSGLAGTRIASAT